MPAQASLQGLTQITITGTDLNPSVTPDSGDGVFVGGEPCSDVEWISTTTVIATVPATGSVGVTELYVVVGSQTSGSLAFTYNGVIVNSISPTSCPVAGCLLTINGAFGVFGTGGIFTTSIFFFFCFFDSCLRCSRVNRNHGLY
jgi:hypothetical protein